MHSNFRNLSVKCLVSITLLGWAAWTATPSAAPAMPLGAARIDQAVESGNANVAPVRPPANSIEVAGLQMIELVFVACRQENCREVSLLYDIYEVSLMTCMIAGQHEVARWKTSNPAWEIGRWSCRYMRSAEKSI